MTVETASYDSRNRNAPSTTLTPSDPGGLRLVGAVRPLRRAAQLPGSQTDR
jgi:hypothetical protein